MVRMILLALLTLQLYSAAADIPPRVTSASESVFRILFLRPRQEMVELPIKEYEEKLLPIWKETSFIGWWIHETARKCRAQKKEKCPLLIDLRSHDGELLVPVGSTSLIGDNKTLYTAPHVWTTYYEFARRLPQTDKSFQAIAAEARRTFIDRDIEFVLFDEKRNVVLNTYDGQPAKIRDYAVGALIPYLYPNIKLDITTDQLEFMKIELSEPLPNSFKPLRRARNITDDKRPNGLVDTYDYGARLFSIGMSADPRVDLEARKDESGYRDRHVLEGRLSRRLIDLLKTSPFEDKRLTLRMEAIGFAVEVDAFHGMSGGPVLNEAGEFVSLNSTVQKVPDLKPGEIAKAPLKLVPLLIGPHPSILP